MQKKEIMCFKQKSVISGLLFISVGILAADQKITVPLSNSIKIDGKVAPGEWSHAARVQGFSRSGTRKLLLAEQCFTYLARDRNNLYFAVQTSNTGQETGTGTVALVKKREGQVFTDDCVELQITLNQSDVYTIIVNSIGTVLDLHGNDKSWNADMVVANIDQSGCWTIEGKIPLKQFKGDIDAPIGISVNRTWVKHGTSSAFGLAAYNDHTTKLIAEATAPCVKENLFTGINDDKFMTALRIDNPYKKQLTLNYALKTLSKSIAKMRPLQWRTYRAEAYLDKNHRLICRNDKPGTALIVNAPRFYVRSGDKVEFQVKAAGKGKFNCEYGYYEKTLAGTSASKINTLSASPETYTFKEIVPKEVKGHAPERIVVRIRVTGNSEISITHARLTINGKEVEIDGHFKQTQTDGVNRHRTLSFDDPVKELKINEKLPEGVGAYQFSYELKSGDKLYYNREICFEKGGFKVANRRPCTVNNTIRSKYNFRLRHYPGFHLAVLELQAMKSGPGGIKKVTAHLSDGGKKITVPLKRGKEFWQGTAKLDVFKDGTTIDGALEITGNGNKVMYNNDHEFKLRLQSFPWENRQLGISDKVIKPFTPIKVTGNIVKTVLRSHTMGDNGLFKQIKALNGNILAAPIDFLLKVGGREQKLKFSKLQFVEKNDHKVVLKVSGKSGSVKYDATVLIEYDGFCWTRAELSSAQPVDIDSFSIIIPLKKQYTSLMHAFADRIRSNPSGAIPEGSGKVWDSSGVPRRLIYGKPLVENGFTPYVWLGEEARGLAWFADCAAGFGLQAKVPQIKIFRPDAGIVKLEVDIINKKVKLTKPRNFEFGMQVTPVKPRPENYRNWYFTHGPDAKGIPGMLNISRDGHGRGQGKASNLNCEPINRDYSLYRYYGQLLKTRKASPDFIKRHIKNIYPGYLRWINMNRKAYIAYAKGHMRKGDSLDDVFYRLLYLYMARAESSALVSDRIIPYTDPRLCDAYGNEVTDYFRCEWWSPQGVSYLGVYRNSLTPGLRDYFLNIYNKIMLAGKGGIGIYIDDSFLVPGDDIYNGTAKLDQDGVKHSVMGILAIRDLIKRLAVLQDQLGIKPRLIMVHMSNCLIIPAHAFADIIYSWEMNYGNKDFQKRFPLDFIRTESTGKQLGALGVVLEGIRGINQMPGDRKQNLRHLTRSAISLLLLHEMVSTNRSGYDTAEYRNVYTLLHKFGIQKPGCTFTGYWDKNNKFKITGGNFKCSYYELNGKILLIVTNMGDKGSAQITCSGKTVKGVDLETGVACDGKVEIPEHELKLIQID